MVRSEALGDGELVICRGGSDDGCAKGLGDCIFKLLALLFHPCFLILCLFLNNILKVVVKLLPLSLGYETM